MANRYWVGGAGTWNTSSTTNWSTSSGGASGASAPTSADNVFFDQAGTYTVTCSGAGCADFNVTAGLVTFSLAVNVYGSVFWGTGNVANGRIVCQALSGNYTITTGGTAIASSSSIGDPGTGTLSTAVYTLGSALTWAGTFYIYGATLNTSTNNYSMTGSSLRDGFSSARSLVLNGSTVTLTTNNITALTFGAGYTLNAGTSTISFEGVSGLGGMSISTAVGPVVFYNVVYSDYYSTSSILQGFPAVGGIVFNNLTYGVSRTTGAGFYAQSIPSSVTVNGALTIPAGVDVFSRVRLYFTDGNIPRGKVSVICNGTVNISGANLSGIAASGSGWATATLTNVSDIGPNSGITFPAAKTVYWNLPAGGNSTSVAWALTSGGTASLSNYPLAQDTIIIDVAGLTAGSTISSLPISYKVDASARTGANTATIGGLTVKTDAIFGDACTVTTVGFYIQAGVTGKLTTGAANLTGATINLSAIFYYYDAGTLQLQNAISCSTFNGNYANSPYYSLDLNNFSLTCSTYFNVSIPNTKTINFGTGNITITGSGSPFIYYNNGSLTGTPTVNHTYSGATATTVQSYGYNDNTALNHNFSAGTYSLTFLQAGDGVGNVNFTGFTGTLAATGASKIYGSLTLVAGMTLSASAQTLTFAAGTGTKTITTAGKTLDFPIAFNGYAGTWAMQDAITMAATRSITLTSGTLQLKSLTTNTVPGGLITSGSAQKYLQSTTAASAATLSVASGAVAVSNITIKDSTATGGATFNASGTSTNGGNNTGWTFAASVVRQNGEFLGLLF